MAEKLSNPDDIAFIKKPTKEDLPFFIGKEISFYYQGKNVSATLESTENKFGHSVIVLNEKISTTNGETLEKGTKITVSNDEILINPMTTKTIKAPKEKQDFGWKW